MSPLAFVALLSLTACNTQVDLSIESEASDPTGAVDQSDEVIFVPTTSNEGGASGLVSVRDGDKFQVVQVGASSSISGTSATFPPGTLAIDTQIIIRPADSVATKEVLSALTDDNQATNTGTAVEITSSAPVEPRWPYTLNIPLPPEGIALLQQGQNPYEKLIIVFKVRDTTTNTDIRGIIPRAEVTVVDQFAQIETRQFGTFQAIVTKELVTDPKQITTAADADIPVSHDSLNLTFFQSGPRVLSTGFMNGANDTGGQSQGGLTLWGQSARHTRSSYDEFSDDPSHLVIGYYSVPR